MEDPFGDIHPQSIIEAWEGIISIVLFSNGGSKDMWSWLLAMCHFTADSQMNYGRYRLVFCMIACPPVARVTLANIFRPSWASITVSSTGVLEEGGIWMIFDLSTKQYPTSLIDYPDIKYLKDVLYPDSIRNLRRGVLMMSQMAGTNPFSWTSLFFGGGDPMCPCRRWT